MREGPRRRSSFSLRASLRPFGIGEQRPNNFGEVTRAAWENRDRPGYAWRILNDGVCDGCALGTQGMRDWTIDGVHLCNIRLRLLRLNTAPAFGPAELRDVATLRARPSHELRELGRLPAPMIRRRGEPGFAPVGWEEALELTAERIGAAGPERIGAYLTSRGTTNETYYAAQKAVRAIGTNAVDNAARVCHSPSTFALKEGLGVGASTCSYTDWLESDVIVFIGSNVANNQPVTTKYLHHAKRNGAKVVVLNPFREPGMERYWIPSVPTSAVFGTKIADHFFELGIGGDLAYLTGALRHMADNGWVDGRFVEERTEGFRELETLLAERSWEELELLAGASREDMLAFARVLGEADRGVIVWSMGVTQHEGGEDNVRAIVNLALARGWAGRRGCGLMPIRGHSGVQGGAEMGCYSTSFPGGVPVNEENASELSEQWGFEVPREPGPTAPEMIDAAHRGGIDTLVSVGGNLLEILPDPEYVEQALGRVPLRVHLDIVLSTQMLVDPADTVLLLPATTRYEVPGGITETSTERRVILSPEIPGPRVGQARPEWEVLLEVARRVRPDRAAALSYPGGTPQLRQEIGRVVPLYRGIEDLRESGDSFQIGGAMVPAPGERFPLPGGRARFAPVAPAPPAPPDGLFAVATRRGKQFNSMVQERRDSITGAIREAVFLSPVDAQRLGITQDDEVLLRSRHGEMRGRAHLAPVAAGSLQVHWPEGNVLLAHDRRSPEAGIPDYNARAEVIPL
jgi:molybdopterin-dependent oxidoreductase alpha subunit